MLPSLRDWFESKRKYRWKMYILAPCVSCAFFIFGMAYMFLYMFADPMGWLFVGAGLLYCWLVYESWRVNEPF